VVVLKCHHRSENKAPNLYGDLGSSEFGQLRREVKLAAQLERVLVDDGVKYPKTSMRGQLL
jgi:hypothetical protein